MPIEFIPTRADRASRPDIDSLISAITATPTASLGNGVLYYGWPKFTDYDSVRHSVDLALVTDKSGLILIRLAANERAVAPTIDSLSQATASAVSQLIRSPILRRKVGELLIAISPIVYVPGLKDETRDDVPVRGSQTTLLRLLCETSNQNLSAEQIAEVRSILEGAKALSRSSRRVIAGPQQALAAAIVKLEDEITSFDVKQRQVALTIASGPQRIRGLAGSGKTVILAMKAALAHLDNPNASVLVTYFTRSLRGTLKRLITRFFRHFGGEGDPNWSRLHVHHGWGRQDTPGVYREACVRAGMAPLSFGVAQQRKEIGQQPFDFVCRDLLASGRVNPYYDLILIDEGQDFPAGFYELCFYLAKGQRDEKQIVWAYDELQDVFDVRVRTPDELFGKDADGQPRILLQRVLPKNTATNDFVLPKCYRNQRDVLVLAHAIGFGLYSQPVQMLQNKSHWEDVGYDVVSGEMVLGSPVVIRRPDRNSPTKLETRGDIPLIQVKAFNTPLEEAEYCADQFASFIEGGLQPEDLMAIAIDDRAAQSYLSFLASALSSRGIKPNNIIADRYNEPAFTIEGHVTLSTVYRAKGNEAAVVAVMGCDAIPLRTRNGRNRLFTAFTRTKGWLRVSGMGLEFAPLKSELEKAISMSPELRFTMPDLKQIELIQRDLSEKDAKLQRAQQEMDRLKETLGLTDDDLKSLISRPRRNGRA